MIQANDNKIVNRSRVTKSKIRRMPGRIYELMRGFQDKAFQKMGLLWKRLQKRDKWPRRWWYPPLPPTLKVSNEKLLEAHKETSVTIRRTMLGMLGFTVYTIYTVLGASDVDLIFVGSSAPIPIPILQIKVNFYQFLIISSILLISLNSYVLVFISYLKKIEISIDNGICEIDKLPTIFNIEGRFSRTLSNIIFYWLTPLALLQISYKALADITLGYASLIATIFISYIFLIMYIRYSNERARFYRNAPVWLIILLLNGALIYLFVILSTEPSAKWPVRPMNFADVDLRKFDLRSRSFPGSNFARANLSEANMSEASFQGANFTFANLREADLRNSMLQGADFSLAILQGAKLDRARLQGAQLERANLGNASLISASIQGASLIFALLQNAKLAGAKLQFADLRMAMLEGANLSAANLTGANLTDARLKGANLTAARLRDARISQAELNAACADPNKQPMDLPNGLVWSGAVCR